MTAIKYSGRSKSSWERAPVFQNAGLGMSIWTVFGTICQKLATRLGAYTVQEVCDLSDIGLGPKLEQPKIILVSKAFKFRHTSDMDVSYLAVEDVREYLPKDAVRCSGLAPSSYQIATLTQKAFAALDLCVRDGQITVEDYCYLGRHERTTFQSHIRA